VFCEECTDFYVYDENICRAQALRSVILAKRVANVSQHTGCLEPFGFRGAKTIKRTVTCTHDKQHRAGFNRDRMCMKHTHTEHRGMLLTNGYCSSRAGNYAQKFALY